MAERLYEIIYAKDPPSIHQLGIAHPIVLRRLLVSPEFWRRDGEDIILIDGGNDVDITDMIWPKARTGPFGEIVDLPKFELVAER